MLAAALSILVAPLAIQAHSGCGGHEVGRANPGGRIVSSYAEWARTGSENSYQGVLGKRQSAAAAAPTDKASAADSIDPDYECTAYSYAPVLALKASYPPVWTTASIVAGDTAATSLFATINATLNAQFPTDLPKGDITGNFTGVNYTYLDPDCWWTWSHCTTPAASTGLKADITTTPEPLTWGLAFDDGPNCSHNAFYDYLQEQNQKATMFYIGSNVLDWPLQALRGYADGHQISDHTWSHRYMTSLTNEEAFAELYYTRQLIKDVIGVTPLSWRPPYGDVDNRIRAIAAGLNLTTVVWSNDSEDWKEGVPADNVTAADVTANYQGVINNIANGTYVSSGPVVLTHELNNFTMSEFISMYEAIKAAFKYIVPIATAYNLTNPYAETNITYPDFLTYTNQTSLASSQPSTSASTSASPTVSGAVVGAVSTTSTSSSSASLNAGATGSATAKPSSGEKVVVGGGLAMLLTAFVMLL